MQRGTITILLILCVAVLAATASVFYHYANQRHAQDFWGAQTAVLIDKAPTVEVMRLGQADPSLTVGEDVSPEEPSNPDAAPAENSTPQSDQLASETVKAVEFNETPWRVLESRDAAQAKGINNLRRVLVLDTTYNWSEAQSTSEPQWQYALGVTDGRDWATVLFDFDSRRVGLAGGRRTTMLHEEAAGVFKGFFEEQFASPENAHHASADAQPQPDPAPAP